MNKADLNYFTCTLGEAATWNDDHPHSFHTLNDLIDGLAKKWPHRYAVGFSNLTRDNSCVQSKGALGAWTADPAACTFIELKEALLQFAALLWESSGDTPLRQSRTIGLLSTSNEEFLLTWLALVRLGFSVLLIAPQLQVPAIEHLCRSREVVVIFADDANFSKAAEVPNTAVINISHLQERGMQGDADESSIDSAHLSATVSMPSDIAYLFHTSGTSSGLPKAIPQTHHGAAAVLPCLPGGATHATFSTTPLYHGGIADCLRAWSSGAMIWLFPEGRVPITADNIKQCLRFVDNKNLCPITYFSSVPYVLQLLAENVECTARLRDMGIVGIGGAALPAVVGDRLVEQGVNLVSRYGSAECGFLMSSRRLYGLDKAWQFLRMEAPAHLTFEAHENDLYELIVKPSWPYLSKTNRPDGSYATSDLFEPHPSIPKAWRYHSRADAQITLLNGKKFDPAPMEADIVSATRCLRDVFVFGNGRDYPGALLFPKMGSLLSPKDTVEEAWPAIEQVNCNTQSHARISRFMLVVAPFSGDETPLEKSSKGTILRAKAENRYAKEVESAYSETTGLNTMRNTPDEHIHSMITEIFYDVLGRHINPEGDVYGQGVDSLASIKIRNLIERSLEEPSMKLPLNVVYDQGTLISLVRYILSLRNGTAPSDPDREPTDHDLMKQLATDYSNFNTDRTGVTRNIRDHGHVVVLTGSTGALGAHLLALLWKDANVHKIYCLVRADSRNAASDRVSQSLVSRSLTNLKNLNTSSRNYDKVVCIPCRLSDSKLGLAKEDWSRILRETTSIIHSAWAVNFTLNLKSFREHIQGTKQLLDLAIASGARFCFISSTASAISSSYQPIPEFFSNDPVDASTLGYSQSKWVAERICAKAHEAVWNTFSKEPDSSTDDLCPSKARISVIRVGQLCGNAEGVWNASEAYPLMLSTARMTGCLPELPEVALDWLPVDVAARGILEIIDFGDARHASGDMPLWHALNWHGTPDWSGMLRWIKEGQQEHAETCHFEIVSPAEWLKRFREILEQNDESGNEVRHPARALLPLWEQLYTAPGAEAVRHQAPVFDMTRTMEASPTLRTLQPLSAESVVKMWNWIQHSIGK